jgi:hypothetical protein
MKFATTTRRTALAALGGTVLLPYWVKAAKKATAFALIGDRYHNSDYIRTGLTKTIAKQLDVTIDFTDETSLLNAETLDGYKLLIVLRDGTSGRTATEATRARTRRGSPREGRSSCSIRRFSRSARSRSTGSSPSRARRCASLSTPAARRSSSTIPLTSG